MKTAIILGANSGIYKQMKPLMAREEWDLVEWKREDGAPKDKWDLVVCFIGTIGEVGSWRDQSIGYEIDSNVCMPIWLLQDIIDNANPSASVCMFAGSNPNMIMPGYLGYNVSKMALLKAVEQIDAEEPDVKVFALGPGIVLTKIHDATLNAKWHNPKLAAAIAAGKSTPPERIWRTLKWCIDQPKDVVGGRNICVSDYLQGSMDMALREDPNLWKLRRYEG